MCWRVYLCLCVCVFASLEDLTKLLEIDPLLINTVIDKPNFTPFDVIDEAIDLIYDHDATGIGFMLIDDVSDLCVIFVGNGNN